MKTIAFIATKDYAFDRIVEAIKQEGFIPLVINPEKLSVRMHSRPELDFNGTKIKADGIIHKMSTDFREGLDCLSAIGNEYPILNPPDAAFRSQNKFLASSIFAFKKIPYPKSIFAQNNEDILEAITKIGFPVIVKQSDGCEGNEVVLIKNKKEMQEKLKYVQKRGRPVIVQEFIEESYGRDLRIIVVGKKVVAQMMRVQKNPKEFRANIHKGAVGEKVKLTDKEKKIAIAAVQALGLDFGGVDILRSKRGPLVLEVNSFPGLRGIESTTGIDIAGKIVQLMIKKIMKHQYNKS